jgi:hypothetical protein
VVVFEERIPVPEMMLRAAVSEGETMRRMIFRNWKWAASHNV